MQQTSVCLDKQVLLEISTIMKMSYMGTRVDFTILAFLRQAAMKKPSFILEELIKMKEELLKILDMKRKPFE